jgi:site-specific recombinase XerD
MDLVAGPPLLWRSLTSHARASSASVPHLPDADQSALQPVAATKPRRRRLAALSSLYKHLVRHDHAPRNPVGEVERPPINRDEGATAAFSKAQARKLLDLPGEDTIAGLRDRAADYLHGLQPRISL